jgi:hypothetical protein
LAATVFVPVAMLVVAAIGGSLDRPDVEWEEIDLATAGYAFGAVVALAGQAVLLWSLVAMHRTGPAGGGTSLVLAGLVFAASVLVLVVPILAFFAFIAAIYALFVLGFAAVPCVLVALIGLVQGSTAPWVVACTGAAGWIVAIAGMPVAGGICVLAYATL